MLIADEMESQLAQTMESFFDAGELDADEEVSAG
jgi:hypothetical protein